MTTAPARPFGAILAEITEGRGKHAKLGRKLRTTRDANWLLALVQQIRTRGSLKSVDYEEAGIRIEASVPPELAAEIQAAIRRT